MSARDLMSTWSTPTPFDERVWVGKELHLAAVKAAVREILTRPRWKITQALEEMWALEDKDL